MSSTKIYMAELYFPDQQDRCVNANPTEKFLMDQPKLCGFTEEPSLLSGFLEEPSLLSGFLEEPSLLSGFPEEPSFVYHCGGPC